MGKYNSSYFPGIIGKIKQRYGEKLLVSALAPNWPCDIWTVNLSELPFSHLQNGALCRAWLQGLDERACTENCTVVGAQQGLVSVGCCYHSERRQHAWSRGILGPAVGMGVLCGVKTGYGLIYVHLSLGDSEYNNPALTPLWDPKIPA